MMKKMLILMIFLIIPIVMADVECSKVFVVKFNYDDGVITYKDKVIKCGYAPDRKLQPRDGYLVEMLSMGNDVLYSFRFEVPLDVNVDLSEVGGELSGGMIILNETDFAWIFPYYDDVKSIVIYNPQGEEEVIVPLIEEQFVQERFSWLWILVVGLLLVVSVFIVYRHFRRPKQPVQQMHSPYLQQYRR